MHNSDRTPSGSHSLAGIKVIVSAKAPLVGGRNFLCAVLQSKRSPNELAANLTGTHIIAERQLVCFKRKENGMGFRHTHGHMPT